MIAASLLSVLLAGPFDPAGLAPAPEPAVVSIPRTPRVTFDGKAYRVDKLPEEIREGATVEIERWADFAEEEDLTFGLTNDQAILFVTPNKPQLKKRLELIEDAQFRTEVLLYGEDEAKERAKLRKKGRAPEVTGTRGPDDLPPESIIDHRSETIVIFEFKSVGQTKTVLARLASEHEYLRSWIAAANERTGYTFEEPLLGGWVGTSEQEEWDPNAELVNRVAQLLLLREYGTMPYWLRMGVAWNIEHQILGGLWCFPYRAEFVFTYEHTSWPNEIQNMFEDRDDIPLEPGEFIDWPLQTYDGNKGRIAFGLVHFLSQHHPDELPDLFEAFRARFAEGQTQVEGNGAWRRIPNYQIPDEDQLKLLEATTREDLLDQATTYFRKKFNYKPRS